MISDYIVQAFITVMLCINYFILIYLFPVFFAQKVTRPRKKPWVSLLFIIFFSVLAYALNSLIQDAWIANRILHIVGGGFTAFLVCFLAARDSRVSINKFQFFIFGFLYVLSLGVANEIFELILQTYFGIISSTAVDDTWLDLASNLSGLIIASVCFVPFHKKEALDHI